MKRRSAAVRCISASGLAALWLLAPLDKAAAWADTSADIEMLIAELGDDDRERRLEAAWRLSTIGPEARAALPALIGMMNDGDGEMRIAAVSAMERLAADANRTVPALIDALEDSEPEVRYAAAGALEQFSIRASVIVPALVDTLYDSEPSVAFAAANALTRMGSLAVPALMGALTSDRAATRAVAAGALGGIGLRARPALDDLVEVANDRDAAVRAAVMRAIGQVASEKETGLRADWGGEFALDPSFPRSEWAVEHAARLAASNHAVAPLAVPPLTYGLRDPDAGVRFAAAKALQKIGFAAGAAISDLHDTAADDVPKVRRAVAGALGRVAPPDQSIPVLVRLLGDDDPTVSWTAGRSIVSYGRFAIPYLLDGLGSESVGVRARAARMLGEIGLSTDAAVGALRSATHDADADVRAAAATALIAIGGAE